jgi:ubiquitin-protein ligase E3 A
VQFIGEEGVDEGGIAKEFFQLLLRDIFDPDYGMFQYDDVTRLHWFRPSTLDQEQEYKLIGIMIGLAIYNSQLLELNFPMVLFKKLTGNALKLDDLREVYPEIHHSLEQVLTCKEFF